MSQWVRLEDRWESARGGLVLWPVPAGNEREDELLRRKHRNGADDSVRPMRLVEVADADELDEDLETLDDPDLEWSADAGMSTVEYAIGTIVAAAFAAVLYKIVTGDSVVTGLTSLINSALNTSL